MPWDELPPTSPPRSLGRGWDQCKTPLDYSSHQPLLTKLLIRSYILDPKQQPVEVNIKEHEKGEEGATVADVKAAFVEKMQLSSRKYVQLRWLGEELDDAKTISGPKPDLKIPNGSALDAAFRKRSLAELEALKTVKHVLVGAEGQCARVPVTGTMLVSALKALCKQPPGCLLCFSQHYNSSLGLPLADEKTLAACGVLDGDCLVFKPDPTVPAEPPKEEAKKKK